MLKFRRHISAKLLAFATGIMFLNMSFFLTEIQLLGMHKTHSKMIENVVKALAGVGFEEEKDSMGESSENEPGHVFDLHMTVHPVSSVNALYTAAKLHDCRNKLKVCSGNTEIIIPPPKVA